MKNCFLIALLILGACTAVPVSDPSVESTNAADTAAIANARSSPTPTPAPLAPQAPIDMGDQAPIIVEQAPADSELQQDGESDPQPGDEVVTMPAAPVTE